MQSRGTRRSTILMVDEFVSDINTPGAASAFAKLIDAPINPCCSLLFPKLASQADSYEKYRFLDLEIAYAQESNTSVSGTVVHCFDYDAQDAAPTTVQQVMDNNDAKVGPPWVSTSVKLDVTQNAQKWFYCQNSSANGAAAADRQQDQAIYRIWADRIGNNVMLGGLFVRGRVEVTGSRPISALALHTVGLSGLTYTFSGAGGVNVSFVQPDKNRGFTPGDRSAGQTTDVTLSYDNTSSIGTGGNWQALGAPVGKYLASCDSLQANVSVGVAWTFSVAEISSAGVVSNVQQMAGGTGTGALQAVAGQAYITTTADKQMVLYFYVAGAATVVVPSAGGNIEIMAVTENQVGSQRRGGVQGNTCFALPSQQASLDEFLSALPPCDLLVQVVPTAFPEPTLQELVARAVAEALGRTNQPWVTVEEPTREEKTVVLRRK